MATAQMPVQVIREHLVGALDLIVQTERLPSGQRKVVNVAELTPKGVQEIYRFERQGITAEGTVRGHYRMMEGLPHCRERLQAFGCAPDAASLREGFE